MLMGTIIADGVYWVYWIGVASEMESLHEETGDLIDRDLCVIEDKLTVAPTCQVLAGTWCGWPLGTLVEIKVGMIVGKALGVHAV